MSDVEDTHFGGRVIDREECEEYCPRMWKNIQD